MKLFAYCSALVLLLLAEGAGAWLKRILGIERKGYHAPIGFAFLFSVAQVLYYPAQFLNRSMYWPIIVTSIVLLFALITVFYDLGDMKRSLIRKESLILVVIAALFILLNEFHDVLGPVLDETVLSLHISDLPMPRYQGYYLFAHCVSWLLALPHHMISGFPAITASAIKIYGFGLVYTITSSMLIIDIVRSFHLRNHWFGFSLMSYLLLNGNYTAWMKGGAWIGLSWSILFVTLSAWVIYTYLNSGNEQMKYLLLPVFAAGLASDNSFGLSGIAILYGFMVYLFSIRKIRSLFDFFTLLIPHAVYSLALSAKYIHPAVSVTLLILYFVFIIRRYRPPIRRWIWRSEEYCFDHWKELFWIAVPAVLAAVSLTLFIIRKGAGLSSYLYYFSDFHEIDGVRDYLFIHSDVLEIVLNLFRWGGLIVLAAGPKESGDHSAKMILLTVLLVFLNPLTTPAISYMTGPSFFHTFHVLFNPFTEAIMFLYIYRMFQWTVIGQWVLEITLCLGAAFGFYGILP